MSRFAWLHLQVNFRITMAIKIKIRHIALVSLERGCFNSAYIRLTMPIQAKGHNQDIKIQSGKNPFSR